MSRGQIKKKFELLRVMKNVNMKYVYAYMYYIIVININHNMHNVHNVYTFSTVCIHYTNNICVQ